jgi:putative ABC transport system permease protein
MTPNFYMMLSPDLTAQLPMSYMTSFHLPAEQEGALVSLIRTYPGITFIDTRAILSQVQSMLQRLTTAVELILVFVLIGALLVMLSVLLTSTRERLMQGAVLRTLGAARVQLQKAQWVEFSMLGVLSALLALLGAELVSAGLYIGLLDIPYSGLGWVWLWLPPATALGLAIPGTLMLRRVSRVPPLTVLREA